MRHTKKKTNTKPLGIVKRLVLYTLIAAFFVCIVYLYYSRLYARTMESITNAGRLNATEAADQIDNRLAKRLNILKLAAHTLDNMIRNGQSKEEILAYLTTESTSVKESLIEDSTGIYGYIKGEYMDGSGWVPDADYVPTERPWYTEGRDGGGRIVMVDPYIDLDTDTMMTAITKLLCDEKSVVGMDMSMEEIQGITEDHVLKKLSTEEYIINAGGQIIAHSNRDQIGKKEDEEADSLEAKIASERLIPKNTQFNLAYEGKTYMIHVQSLDLDWKYISVIDATEDIRNLRIPLIITIATAIVIMAALLFFMIRSDRKARQVRGLALKSERALAASEAKS